jgi:hypothetical protein
MNCFKCGFRCKTIYIYVHPHTKEATDVSDLPLHPITHVASHCNMCQWTSHYTQIPETIVK